MKLIPDSSFFICFIGDLEGLLPARDRLDYLHRFADYFDVIITPTVNVEVQFSDDCISLKEKIDFADLDEYIQEGNNLIEPLRPIWSKGEYEVILIAYYFKTNEDTDFLFVLDDGQARVLINNFIHELKNNLIGTVGLVRYCNHQQLFKKQEATNLLLNIKKSKFRINPSIIDGIIKEIEAGAVGGQP